MAGGAGSEPAGADADVVDVLSAVGVGLGPFTCEGGAESTHDQLILRENGGQREERAYPVDVSMLALCWSCQSVHAYVIFFW